MPRQIRSIDLFAGLGGLSLDQQDRTSQKDFRLAEELLEDHPFWGPILVDAASRFSGYVDPYLAWFQRFLESAQRAIYSRIVLKDIQRARAEAILNKKKPLDSRPSLVIHSIRFCIFTSAP